MKKLVLAYSGGLDTSYCIKSLSQSGYEVHAVSVNTGGFDKTETEKLAEKAHALGAASYTPIDAVSDFMRDVNTLSLETYSKITRTHFL